MCLIIFRSNDHAMMAKDEFIGRSDQFGSVSIWEGQVERTDVDVSFHYIGILVGSGNHIHDQIFIKWRGKTIKVWVEEDAKEWLGDFVDKYEVGGRRSSSSGPEHSPASEVNADEKVSEEEDFTGSVFMTPINADLLPIVQEDGNKEPVNGGRNLRDSIISHNWDNNLKDDQYKSNKRKKAILKKNMCQPNSGEYNSSNDMPMKEPKTMEDDIFGLDPII
ncbi:hypothetical protein Hanom_Chr09g00819101 [Helianthus anomalus]